MEGAFGPLNWEWEYQEEAAHRIEELKLGLLHSRNELETRVTNAYEEIAKKRDEVLHVKSLLTKTIKERDEFEFECRRLVLENIILRQEVPILKVTAAAATATRVTPVSSIQNDSFVGVVSSSQVDGKFTKIQESNRVLVPSPPPPPPPPYEFDNISLTKGLPEKGKFLQAIMEAGPLLQTLLFAGQLPQWQNEPPRHSLSVIPPASISLPLGTASRVLIHQDSSIKKRHLEHGHEVHDYDSPRTINAKNQKVVQ